MPWALGPLLSPRVTLTWALAPVVARFVLYRVVGGRRGCPDGGLAKGGFRAGLRLTTLRATPSPGAILWANRMLAAS